MRVPTHPRTGQRGKPETPHSDAANARWYDSSARSLCLKPRPGVGVSCFGAVRDECAGRCAWYDPSGKSLPLCPNSPAMRSRGFVFSSRRARTVGGHGALLQKFPKDIAFLVHGSASIVSLGCVDVNGLATDMAKVNCLGGTGHTAPRFPDRVHPCANSNRTMCGVVHCKDLGQCVGACGMIAA